MRDNPCCLIVGDEALQSEILRKSFKVNLKPLNITCVHSVASAIQFLKTNKIDLMVLDIHMSGNSEFESGLEFGKWLRAQRAYKWLPFLIVTNNLAEAAVNAKALYAFRYIEKPRLIEDAREAAEAVLDLWQNGARYFSEEESDQILNVMCNGKVTQFDQRKILFFEYNDRKLIVNASNGISICKRISLKTILDMVTEDFFRVHQSFVINAAYIRHVDLTRDCMFIGEDRIEIPIGRRYKKDFMEQLTFRNVIL